MALAFFAFPSVQRIMGIFVPPPQTHAHTHTDHLYCVIWRPLLDQCWYSRSQPRSLIIPMIVGKLPSCVSETSFISSVPADRCCFYRLPATAVTPGDSLSGLKVVLLQHLSKLMINSLVIVHPVIVIIMS